MRQQSRDLHGNVCQNCVNNYQKLEVKEQELKEVTKRLQAMELNQKNKADVEVQSLEHVQDMRLQLDKVENQLALVQGELEEVTRERDGLKQQVVQMEEKLQ